MAIDTRDIAATTGVAGRATARRRVRHFLADFSRLETDYPDTYPRLIVRGEGAFLYDDEGARLLDAGISLGACQIGHGRKELAQRLAAQAEQLEFVALDSGVSHPYVAALAERMATFLPLDDPKLSFASSGSEANEIAFKIARAYHARRGDAGRTKILSRVGSYHGSTLGGVSATGSPAFQAGFAPLVPDFVQVPHPTPGRCDLGSADALERAIEEEGAETVAAVIAEPVSIFGAVKIPHPDYWSRVRAICDAAGALLIVDEVVTGFGRTGRMLGSDHWGIRPDLMTFAKGLTSGYVPMGATAVSAKVEEPFADAPLLHLNTFAGHPLACEAAMAVLDVLERERLVAHAASLEPFLRERLEDVAERVARAFRVSVIGLLGSIEFDVADRGDVDELVIRLRHDLHERGVIARCAGGDGTLSVVVNPPLVVTRDDLDAAGAAIADAAAAVLG